MVETLIKPNDSDVVAPLAPELAQAAAASSHPAVDQANATVAAASAQEITKSKNSQPVIEVKGIVEAKPSPYWVATVPWLSARYVAEGLNKVMEPYTEIKFPKWHDKAWSIGVGAAMMIVTGVYTSATYGDMKRLFAESVGWELNKDPSKVNLIDIVRSKNTIIHDTIKNFGTRTILRFSVNLPFFAYLVPSPFKKLLSAKNQQQAKDISEMKSAVEKLEPGLQKVFEKIIPKLHDEEIFTKLSGPKNAVNLGVGANAMYLASDVLFRKETFFEEMQNFAHTKLNRNNRIGDLVTATDLVKLYARQSDYGKSILPLPEMNTPQWREDMKLFSRMADLMNQTYGNTPNVEDANFTMPKLIYLFGMKHVGKSKSLENDLAYVEVANRHGIQAVEKMAKVMKSGGNLETALALYPDAMKNVRQEAAVSDAAHEAQADSSQKTFANEGLKASRPDMPPANHVEKASQSADAAAGRSLGA